MLKDKGEDSGNEDLDHPTLQVTGAGASTSSEVPLT